MKFTPEVVAALEVLRTAAENDFERHRLDVLERDLTAPPVAEQVDEKHQCFDGVIYVKRKDNHYFRQTGIHRDIWLYYYGDISQDCDIHHVDRNPANNNIGNLQCMTKQEHGQQHISKGQTIPRSPQKIICTVCGCEFEGYNNGQPQYCSEHCRNVFRYHNSRKQEKVCEWCGKKFFGKKSSRYCSGHCATTARYAKLREEGKTKAIQKVCPICGNEFFCFPSNPHETCSASCGQQLRRQRAHAKN